MLRIGIIGTESTHAIDFARLINLKDDKTGEYRYENVRVVGVYGPDKESAQEIMDKVGVDFIASKPEDFFGKVDAMMITSRRGSVHYDYAMPFIKLGMPIFIDKPITTDNEKAMNLIEQAKANNVLVAGGSCCKYACDVQRLKNSFVQMMGDNKFCSGAINFSIEVKSVYDGFFFYSSHLVEMALTIFGYDIKSVRAVEKNGTVVVIARYEGFDVTLHFTDDSSISSCVLFCKDKNIYSDIDISATYNLEIENFVLMIRTGKMHISYDEIIKPVFVINAIIESLNTDKEVHIKAV